VEDEPAVLASLRRRLQLEGFSVDTAVTGLMALEMFEPARHDLVVLDVMLPELDGFQVASRLRQQSQVPILMLTARESVSDRVHGLEMGADDYLVKPFAFEELLARVRALLRRTRPPAGDLAGDPITFAGISLDPSSRQVNVSGRDSSLTPREFDLLAYLLRHPRQVLTREQIFTNVWGYDHEGTSNLIDVYIRSLRDKLEEQGEARLLHTVRGVGYVLRE
jgi:two-component system response regulator MprA